MNINAYSHADVNVFRFALSFMEILDSALRRELMCLKGGGLIRGFAAAGKSRCYRLNSSRAPRAPVLEASGTVPSSRTHASEYCSTQVPNSVQELMLLSTAVLKYGINTKLR